MVLRKFYSGWHILQASCPGHLEQCLIAYRRRHVQFMNFPVFGPGLVLHSILYVWLCYQCCISLPYFWSGWRAYNVKVRHDILWHGWGMGSIYYGRSSGRILLKFKELLDYCCDEIAKLWAPILIVLEAHLVGAELFHRVGQCSRSDVVDGHFADESSFFDPSWVQSIVSYLGLCVLILLWPGSTWLSSVTNTKFRTYLSTLLPSGTCMIHRMWSGAQFIKVQLISWMGGSYPALSLQLWLVWFEFFLSLCYKPILPIRGHL